jgi:hypothetical protein
VASFVLATPEIACRVGDGPERRALFDPIMFLGWLGQPSDVWAYGATLPADASRKPSPDGGQDSSTHVDLAVGG